MIAVDTNLLVYAHRIDSPWHGKALTRLKHLAEGESRWGIPWPCIHEFLAIVTHPKIYSPATPADMAVDVIRAWMKSPSLTCLSESRNHLDILSRLVTDGKVAGGQIHDARIAAICIGAHVREFWTLDRDFSRFPSLRVKNPLV